MNAPEIAAWSHLDRAVNKLWRIEASISGALYLGLLVGVGFILNEALDGEVAMKVHPALLTAGLGVLLVVWLFVVAGMRYEYWRFLLGTDDLAVAHGIWWRTRIYVPRARIQHVDVTAGPISRALGLSVVSVFVGGHSGAVATIPGLLAEDAETLRRRLLHVEAPSVVPPPEGMNG